MSCTFCPGLMWALTFLRTGFRVLSYLTLRFWIWISPRWGQPSGTWDAAERETFNQRERRRKLYRDGKKLRKWEMKDTDAECKSPVKIRLKVKGEAAADSKHGSYIQCVVILTQQTLVVFRFSLQQSFYPLHSSQLHLHVCQITHHPVQIVGHLRVIIFRSYPILLMINVSKVYI